MTGTLDDDSSTSDSVSFTVEFTNACESDVITYASGVDASYTYDFDSDIVITPVFTSTEGCPFGPYTATFVDQSDSTAYTDPISVDSSTGVVTIASDLAQSYADATYTLTISAYANYGDASADATASSSITFVDPCDSVTLVAPVVPAGPITLWSFHEQTTTVFTPLSYTDSDGDVWNCGTPTYVVEHNVGGEGTFVAETLSFLSLDVTDPANPALLADLEEFEHQEEDYEFRIVATLGDYGSATSNTFTYDTKSSCEITTV
mmetsp:Transcript_15784/g.11140  ORF Transcript_15784/g.11140 Transcript_15784/m.11140 type:complete len:262 (-) Transcript_15784:465-1250(-)